MNFFKLIILTIIIIIVNGGYFSGINAQEDNSNHIYLKLLTKEVCSNRANKCWPVATGRKENKTPNIKGPHFVLNLHKNGFNWQNPFTKQIYKKGTHNLGNIWIGVLTTKENIEIGFHKTPTPNIPLSQQESLGGCLRMNEKDIIEFSTYVNLLDEIYILNE